MLKLQKIIVLLFVVATLTLNGVLLYSLNLYFGTYTAVRDFEIKMLRVKSQMTNDTYAEVKIDLGFRNPSIYTLLVYDVAQHLYVNDAYVMHITTNGSKGNPLLKLSPNSSFNLSIVEPIPYTRFELFAEPANRTWVSIALVLLEAPLTGTMPVYYQLVSQEETVATKTQQGIFDNVSQ